MTSRFGATSLSTMYGFISLPSLAIAAVTIAIWSGVVAVLNWPMEESALPPRSICLS